MVVRGGNKLTQPCVEELYREQFGSFMLKMMIKVSSNIGLYVCAFDKCGANVIIDMDTCVKGKEVYHLVPVSW